MYIFSDVLIQYKSLIQEGNTLLFHVDINRENDNLRIIIRKIESLEKIFNNHKLKFNIY